jgi:formate dehydrogenase iron-sulfur subunit
VSTDDLDRRDFLAWVAAAAGVALRPESASGEAAKPAFDHAYSILYDATRCIGCRACSRRCREVNNLPPDRDEVRGVAFDMPRQLSASNFTVIQAFTGQPDPATGEQRWSYVKRNCMHCNQPACASACPVAALQKTDSGPVLYFEDRCIGCRYCLLACPYQVPRYEWLNRSPRVRKCNLNGACVKACPVNALVDGPRAELIAEAHRRIDEHPGRYVNHVYGEHEGGGTSVLMLSAIPLENMGFPRLAATAPTTFAEPILSAVPGWVVGLGLFLGALYRLDRSRRNAEPAGTPPLKEATP